MKTNKEPRRLSWFQNILINLFLGTGLTLCLVAAIIILVPVVLLAALLAVVTLPIYVVGVILILFVGFLDCR